MALKRILLLSFLIFLLFSCDKSPEKSSINITKDVDTLLFQKKYGDAEALLLKAAGKTDKRVPLSEIIKRALQISRESSDYNFLVKISRKVIKQNPREEFYASLVYAWLRKGEIKKAYNLAQKHLIAKKWDKLHAEINFKYKHDIPQKYGTYTLLTHNYYDHPDELYMLAEQTGNSALYLNAALLSVFTKKRQDVIAPYLEKAALDYPQKSAAVAFHNHLYQLCIKIGEIVDSPFLESAVESFYLKNDFSGAYDYLCRHLSGELQKNWKAMFNFLWVKTKISSNIDYADIEKANYIYPGNPYFNLLYIDFLNESGQSKQALALLSRIRQNEQSNYVSAYYDFYLPDFSESRFISYFWKELHSKGEDMDINLLYFYLWFFCNTGNYSDLSMALQHVKNDIGDFYTGIILAYYGYYTLSEIYFLKYAETHNYWEIYYNLFLINADRGKLKKAGDYLYKSYNIYYSDDNSRTEKSTLLILHTLAAWEYKLGNKSRSLEYLDIILQHDKTDSKANILRDQILGEGEMQ